MPEVKQRAKQYKRTQITALKYNLLKIIRDATPKDTGNLKQNATYAYNTSYGFNVVVSSTYAHYVKYVNNPSIRRMSQSKKVLYNAYYIDKALTKCTKYIKDFERNYKTPLEKKSIHLTPLFTTSNFQDKVLNDEMKGDVVNGYGSYYKMNKRLQRSVLQAYNEEEIDIDYDVVDDFEESGD